MLRVIPEDSGENKASITRILIDNYDEIIRRLRWRMGKAVDPDDVVQDAFLKLQAIPADTQIDNPRSYVFRVVDNLALDQIRRRKTQARYFSSEEMRDTAADAPSPERITDYRQRLDRLAQAVDQLPPRQQEAFLMHKFDGLTHAEIAEKMSITKSAVEKLIMKALATCRNQMGDLLDRES